MASLLDLLLPQPTPMQNSGLQMADEGPSFGDPRSISGKIQEWLGARPANQGGITSDILSKRFQAKPTLDDVSQGAIQTLFSGRPVSSQGVADQRMSQTLEKLQAIKKLQGDEGSFDLDGMAQQAAYKASLGIPLNPQEEASIKAYSGFHPGGTYIDPATQSLVQKPNLFEALGFGKQTGGPEMPAEVFSGMPNMGQQDVEQVLNGQPLPTGPNPFPSKPNLKVSGPLAGTPRAQMAEMDADLGLQKQQLQGQQTLSNEKNIYDYKHGSELSQDQSRAATYYDRANEAEGNLKGLGKAQTSLYMRSAANAPAGNYAVSPEYQRASQAETNFLSAVLRLESGATIRPEEFAYAASQYFPQPGDGPSVIAQKAKNRATAIQGLRREAGPAYDANTTQSSASGATFLGFE